MTVADTAAGEQALCRSLMYQVLATALRYPSPRGLRPDLFQGQSCEWLPAESGELGRAFDRLRARLDATTPEQIEEAYVGIFGHSVRGACPQYESEYGEARGAIHVPHQMSDLGAFYRAFGLRVSADAHERVDHITTELEFMHFLTYKESYAEETGDPELAAASRRAQIAFLSEHLGRWAPAFFRRLGDADRGGVYEALAHFALAFVGADCGSLGVESGSERLRLIVRTETRDDAFDCGVPSDCPGSRSGGAAPQGGAAGAGAGQ